MEEIIAKYGDLSNFLLEVKKSMLTIEEKKKKLNLLKGKKSTFTENEKKLQETKDKLIEKTISDKKKELTDSINQKLVSLDQELKKAKQDKEKEKQKIIKEKIAQGTKTENENIIFLNNNLKNILKVNKINPIVNTDLYYDLIAPYTVTNYIKGFIIFLVFFILLPMLICFIFKNKINTIWLRIMLFVINTFIFGGIYLILCHIGKCDKNVLEEIKGIRKDIKENKKNITNITNKITNEKEEENKEVYTKIDRMIESINLQITELKDKEAKEIEVFENSTKNVIINEIEKESKKDFSNNEKELKKALKELEVVEKEFDEIQKQIEEEFINKIGKENYNEKMIDKIIEVVNNDSTITLENAIKLAKK